LLTNILHSRLFHINTHTHKYAYVQCFRAVITMSTVEEHATSYHRRTVLYRNGTDSLMRETWTETGTVQRQPKVV